MSVLEFLDEDLALLEQQHRRRVPRVVGGAQGARIVLDGREVVSFSSNDYLGLASHPALVEAAHRAAIVHGVGAGASRLIVGNTQPHVELERAAAALLHAPAARLFNSGFAANTGLLPVLAGADDAIYSDAQNHASIIDGCRLSRAGIHVFRHGDLSDLEELLRASRARRRVIVTESVFSMDGDLADLVALRSLADRHDAILVVDEAHGVGVFGDDGGGVHVDAGVHVDVTMATLGKALGVYGAVVAGPEVLAEVLWNRARSLVFTTAMPAMVAASATAAIGIVRGVEGRARRAHLWARVEQTVMGLRALGLESVGSSPIIPLVVGDDHEVMRWTARLLEKGVFVQGVRPPTVPEGTARLRIALSASHSAEDVELLLGGIRSVLDVGGQFVSRGTRP